MQVYFEVYRKGIRLSVLILLIGLFAGNKVQGQTIAISDGTITAANSLGSAGSVNIVIYQVQVTVSGSAATLTGASFVTGGTYTAADIANLKLWYYGSTASNFAINWPSHSPQQTIIPTGSGNTQTFTGLSASIPVGTGYLYVTADVACGTATTGHTININAITTANLTFSSGTVSGTAIASGAQTIIYTTPQPVRTVNPITSPLTFPSPYAVPAGNMQMILSWIPGGCVDEYMVVTTADTGNNGGTPTGNGSAYTANSAYGSGTAFGNGYVVYMGTNSPAIISALTTGTTYYFKIFSRIGTTWTSGVETSAVPTDMIANWNMGDSLRKTYADPNFPKANVSDLTLGPGLSLYQYGGYVALFNGFTSNTPPSTANTSYYQVQLTVPSGHTVSLSEIQWNIYCPNGANPVIEQWAYQLSGTVNVPLTLIGTPLVRTKPNPYYSTVDFSGVTNLQNIPPCTVITLRYYCQPSTTTWVGLDYEDNNPANPFGPPHGLTLGGLVAPGGSGGLNLVLTPGDTTVCSGSHTQLNVSGGATYSWSPVINLSCTGCSNPVASPTATTTYIVTGSNGTCTANDSVIITIGSGFALNAYPADTTICSGTPAPLSSSGATSYSWSPSTGLSCTNCANPVANPTITTTYTVIGLNGGCSNSDTVLIKVGNNAYAGVVTAVRDTICAGTRGDLTLSGNSSNTIQWQSSATQKNFTNTGIIDTTQYQTNPLSLTTYYRAVVGSGSCVDTSQFLQLFVPPALTAGFRFTDSGKTITFIDSSFGDIISYSWNFGDGTTDTAKNPVHTFSKIDTTYNVCLTIYDGSNCSYTFCKDVSLATGIANVSAQTEWNIYPDPFSDFLFINGKELSERITGIEIYDMLRRIVLNFEQGITDKLINPLQLNVSELKEGIYFVKIKTNQIDYIQKIIKQ